MGTLFITATAASLVGTGFKGSILDAPDYLTKLSVNGNHVLVGALLAFVAAAASASIAISLYPLLKRYNEGLALGSVGFRLIEGVFYIVGVIGLLLLLALSQEYVKAGSPDSSYFRTLGVLLLAGYHWAGFVLGAIAFSIGALMYYYIFYQTRLIPRWLSGWGLIGAALCMVAGLLVMLGLIIPVSTIHIVLNLPIAVQEMVFAVWLIVKGFNPSVIASGSNTSKLSAKGVNMQNVAEQDQVNASLHRRPSPSMSEKSDSSVVVLDRDEWQAFSADVKKLIQEYKTLPTRHRPETTPTTAALSEKFCHHCGAERYAEEKFCRICGTSYRFV